MQTTEHTQIDKARTLLF